MRLVGWPALEDEAAVAIAAFDEACFVVDLVIDAGMAERGGDGAGPVALDRGGGVTKKLGWRWLG